MQERNFKIGIVQMSCTPEPEQNLERAIAHVREAASRAREIVCLPELFQTQYFCQREDIALFDLAETDSRPDDQAPGRCRARAEGHDRRFAVRAARAGVYHNTAAIIDAGRQARGHLPQDAHPRRSALLRKVLFHAGRSGFKAFETDFGKFGTLVCWDQWYPEGARLTALQGANVLFYPTAIGWHPDEKAQYGEAQYDAWRPFSARTPSPTACMSRCPIVSASRPATSAASKPAARGWSSGVARSSPIPLAR